MKDNDRAAMANSVTDTANPGGKEASVKVIELDERRQAARPSGIERRRDPHSVRAGNPDRRNPDRRGVERQESDKRSGDEE